MQETYSIAFQWSRTGRWLYTTGRWLIIRSAVLRLQADRGLKPKSKAVITWKAFPCRQVPAAGLYRARIMNNWGQIIMQIIIQIITWKAFPYKQVLDAGLQRAQQMDDNHIFHLLPCCQDCSEVRFKSKEPQRIIIWSTPNINVVLFLSLKALEYNKDIKCQNYRFDNHVPIKWETRLFHTIF